MSVDYVSPRMVSVLVTGDNLDAYGEAAPTSHLKVFLPAEGQTEPLLPQQTPDGPVYPDGPPPVVRTYTPRSYDPETRILEIQFLLHGTGPASEWAQRAKPGDKLAVGGPGGRFALEPVADHWWLAADESAIPAVGTLLDVLPETATVEVHIEVEGPDDEIGFESQAKTSITWHHRSASAASSEAFGAELARAAREASIPDGARVGWPARRPRCATSGGTSSSTARCRATRSSPAATGAPASRTTPTTTTARINQRRRTWPGGVLPEPRPAG